MEKVKAAVGLLFILLCFHWFPVCPSVLANFIPPPPPTVDISINPDGSVEPSNVPIRREGNIYILTGDLLNHTLTIERNNIVIDGAGFTLNKDGLPTELFLETRTNVTIINLCVYGVYLHSSTNNVLAKNTINSVILDYSSSNEITLTLSSNETLTWTAYRLDSKNMVEITEQTTLSGVFDGTHTITFYAKDTAGNILSSKTVYFTIDTIDTLPTIWVIVTIASVFAFGLLIAIAIYRRRKTSLE